MSAARTHRRGIPVSDLRAARLQREAAERKQRIACCAAIKAYLLENLKPSTTKLELRTDVDTEDGPRTAWFCKGLWESDEFKRLCAKFERVGGWRIEGGHGHTGYKLVDILSVHPIE